MTDVNELIERLRADMDPDEFFVECEALCDEAADALTSQAARIAELVDMKARQQVQISAMMTDLYECVPTTDLDRDGNAIERLVPKHEIAEARVAELERQLANSEAKNARLEAVITSTISEVELMKDECVEATTERDRGFYAGLAAAADSMMIAKARTDCGEPETWLHEKVQEMERQLADLKKEAAEALEPFADAARYYSNSMNRIRADDAEPCGPALLVRHLRAARAFLAKLEGGK